MQQKEKATSDAQIKTAEQPVSQPAFINESRQKGVRGRIRRVFSAEGLDNDAIERSKVIRIAWPVLIELLLSSLFSMVDMMMLGNIAGRDLANQSVAAVGIVNQPLYVGIALIQALNVGGTAMIARYSGAGLRDRIEQVVKHVILLSFTGLTIPFVAASMSLTPQIMRVLGAENAVVLVGTPYFRIILVGFIFQSLNLSLAAALRGVGETRAPMKINLIANFVNVIGNAILIYGLFGAPALGIRGAGLSTAFCHVIAFILMLRQVTSGRSQIYLSTKNRFRFSRDVLFNLVKIGVPASAEQMIMRVGLLLFVRIVASLGTVVFAAHQIALSILGLSFNPGMAFGIAAASLMGHSLGRKDPGLASRYAREARRVGSIIASVLAVLFFALAPQLAGLYNKDPLVIANAVMALRLVALIQPFQSSQLILTGALRGAGDTVWPMIATFACVLVVRVSLAYLFVFGLDWGLTGAWLAVVVDQLMRWVIIYSRFRSGKWQHVTIR